LFGLPRIEFNIDIPGQVKPKRPSAVPLQVISREVNNACGVIQRRYNKFKSRYTRHGIRGLNMAKTRRCYRHVLRYMHRLDQIENKLRRSKSPAAPKILYNIELARKMAKDYGQRLRSLK
jgi:hypothetical protein